MLIDLEKDLNFRTRIFCTTSADIIAIPDACTAIFNQLEKSKNKSDVIKQVYFVNCCDNESFELKKNQIQSSATNYFGKKIPITIVPQPSLNGALICAEFLLLENIEYYKPLIKSVQGIDYLVLHTCFGELILSPGLNEYSHVSNIYIQSLKSFEKAKLILQNENLDFSDIIRQWNYIEKIVDNDNSGQHYQVFNDVRTKFYDECKFQHGFPAATGIGMECGGIIIDFIAARKSNKTSITPIKSPVQADAHRYSEQVLAEAKVSLDKLKTTPKFERAKSVSVSGKGLFFISGTAAIKGESSLTLSCKEQTLMTLDNIFSLCSSENLNYHKLEGMNRIICLRVYVKNSVDYHDVRDALECKAAGIPVIFVKADICRPELLVEIEGMAEIN